MNFKKLLLVTCCVITSQINASDNDMTEEQMRSLENRIRFVERSILPRVERPLGEVIVLLGRTGSGKSTAANHMIHISLEGRRSRGSAGYSYYVREDPNPRAFEIGHTIRPQTSIPELRDHGGRSYGDCPGQGDTRGPEQRLLNSYGISRLLNAAESARVVMYCPVQDLFEDLGRRLAYLQLIENVSGIFRNNIEDLLPSLSLIITARKYRDREEYNIDLLREILTVVSEEAEMAIAEERREAHVLRVLRFLGSAADFPNERIAFFDAPNAAGQLASDQDRVNLEAAMIHGNPLILNPGQALVQIGAEERELLRTFYRTTISSRTAIINDSFPAYIEDRIRNTVVDGAELLRRSLLEQPLALLRNIVQNPHTAEKVRNLEELLTHMRINTADQALQTRINEVMQRNISFIYDFLPLLGERTENTIIGEEERQRPFAIYERYYNDLDFLVREPTPDRSPEHMIIEGGIVGVSDIVRLIGENPAPKSLVIRSPHTFLVEGSLTLPGSNMVVFAPNWKVLQNATFNLKGADAQHQPKHIRNGAHGVDGGSGGHFYGYGHTFQDMGKLTINVSGGNGGNGADGEHGSNGVNGTFEDIKSEKEQNLVAKQYIKWGDARTFWGESLLRTLLTFNVRFEEVYLSPWPCCLARGKPGQKGGEGGVGGYPGIITINGVDQLRVVSVDTPGEFGEFGEPGVFGRDGELFGGIKTVEYTLPYLRGITDTSENEKERIENLIEAEEKFQDAIDEKKEADAELQKAKAAIDSSKSLVLTYLEVGTQQVSAAAIQAAKQRVALATAEAVLKDQLAKKAAQSLFEAKVKEQAAKSALETAQIWFPYYNYWVGNTSKAAKEAAAASAATEIAETAVTTAVGEAGAAAAVTARAIKLKEFATYTAYASKFLSQIAYQSVISVATSYLFTRWIKEPCQITSENFIDFKERATLILRKKHLEKLELFAPQSVANNNIICNINKKAGRDGKPKNLIDIQQQTINYKGYVENGRFLDNVHCSNLQKMFTSILQDYDVNAAVVCANQSDEDSELSYTDSLIQEGFWIGEQPNASLGAVGVSSLHSSGCGEDRVLQELQEAMFARYSDDWKDDNLKTAKVISRQSALAEGKSGPTEIDGWDLHNVDDEGNCFYDAVSHQMELINHPFLRDVPPGTLPRDSLRIHVRGSDEFRDGEWAEQEHIDAFLRRFDVILAVVDTRTPDVGFTYYYLGEDGDMITAAPNAGIQLPVKQIIKIATTGPHFLSVKMNP